MAAAVVNQTHEKSFIAAEAPKGALEAMATSVFGATESFFTAFTSKVDEMSGKLLGLENKAEVERLPFTTLHPYKMPAKAQSLLSEKLSRRSIQALLIFLVALRIDNNAVDRHLRAKEKASSRHDHMENVKINREETEKTVKSSTTSGGLAGLIQIAPLFTGLFLQHVAAPFTGPKTFSERFESIPNLNDKVALEDATKLIRSLLQGPAGFLQSLSQNKNVMMQADSFYFQSLAQKSLEKGQSASAAMRENSQATGRDIDEAGRLLDSILQSMQRIHQQS